MFIYNQLFKTYKQYPLKRLIRLCLVVSTILLLGLNGDAQSVTSLYQADPTIFLYKDSFYLYGTNDLNPDIGIKAFVSADMKAWHVHSGTDDGYVLKKGKTFGNGGFWAPQVWYYEDKFYMGYVADEQLAIAVGNSPLGPFSVKQPIAFEQKNIDPYVFIDDGRKKYLFHVDESNGNRIYVAEINDDFSAIKPETRTLCISATEPWEKVKANVTEGPTVIKHNGVYYLIYSANDFRSPAYAIGYATSKSIYGPWKKYTGNPILSQTNTGIAGTGHGDIFFDKRKTMYYVFHTHNSSLKATPRRTAIVRAYFAKESNDAPDRLIMDVKSLYYLKKK